MARSSSRARTPSKKSEVSESSTSASKNDKSQASSTGKSTPFDVLLFYPNIIGYIRVISMIASLYYARSDWKKCLACYGVAFGGDVVDGWVARRFNQSSIYGGVLDMVTDRVSTAGFLCMLSTLYPEHSFSFSMLAVLDIASHWFHVASVALLTVGAGHKSETALRDRNPLLRWYYSIYILFGYCCVGAECFYILLYAYFYTKNPTVLKLALYGCGPACATKNVINLVQMWSAAYSIAERDAENRSSKK